MRWGERHPGKRQRRRRMRRPVVWIEMRRQAHRWAGCKFLVHFPFDSIHVHSLVLHHALVMMMRCCQRHVHVIEEGTVVAHTRLKRFAFHRRTGTAVPTAAGTTIAGRSMLHKCWMARMRKIQVAGMRWSTRVTVVDLFSDGVGLIVVWIGATWTDWSIEMAYVFER